MERVVTINLNGNPYQLEEPAYDALRAYLDRARAALAANPDQAEIIRDLEQAIADKCAGYLSPSKSVVNASEMTRILEEMGPVEGESTEAPRAERAYAAGDGPTKRLYRIKDDAMIAGICTGLAAYLNVDVTVVRVLAIVGGLLTGGWLLLLYAIAMFLIPSAHTSEEWAAAHGVPFNAQEVIDRAKREYSKFTDENGPKWRAEMRRQRREWRDRMKNGRPFFHMKAGVDRSGGASEHGAGPSIPPAQPAGYATRVIAGLFAFIFSVMGAALLIAFLVTMIALIGTGGFLGWTPPLDIPFWLVVVIVCIVFAAISAPIGALRRASYATVSGQRQGGGGADGLITLAIVALVGWFAWLYVPDARDLMEQSYVVLRDFADHWNTDWFWN
jgi:phage shock protein PspC (stress-responsive transcriptional regulator)